MCKNKRLIECIEKAMDIENSYLVSKSEELRLTGVAVIELRLPKKEQEFLNTNWIEITNEIQGRDFKTKTPAHGYVLGAFGAFGNPASFHSKEIYTLRYIIFNKLKNVFKNLDSDRKLEMLFDRLAIRREGTTLGGETFHRDTCSIQEKEDQIYGGWINLDSEETQYFSCIPGTHLCKGRGGFEKIQGKYKDTKVKIAVKPKNIIIFDQNIIHEIFSQKIKKTNIRLYLGWRHTYSNAPLLNDPKDPQKNIVVILRDQIVPILPSGDVPYMYSKQHPGLHRHMVIQVSREIKDFYKIKNDKYEDGSVIARSLVYPIEKINIPDVYKTIYYPNNI
tara:strand:- start:1884 stop:2885 length:1002 start_codon:yes stop_codon:yes gene_type:complete